MTDDHFHLTLSGELADEWSRHPPQRLSFWWFSSTLLWGPQVLLWVFQASKKTKVPKRKPNKGVIVNLREKAQDISRFTYED